jgi:hypothetical protein
MEYAVIALPAAPVRRKPDHRSEMVSQLLFGETVKVLKEKGKLWIKVKSLHDEYEGWTTSSLIMEVSKEFALKKSFYVAEGLLGLITIGDKKMNIPAGSSLPGLEVSTAGTKGALGSAEYTFSGTLIKRDEQEAGETLIRQLTTAWLNAPYLWGGRSILGVDCSGFVQVIYKMMGIDLPRDAWQQAQEGSPIRKFNEAKAGDLAFFNNKEEVVHVGILLGEGKIIHASGKVRIDTISKKGIINDENGKKGLRLEALRRVFRRSL